MERVWPREFHWSYEIHSSNNTRDNFTHGHLQMVSSKSDWLYFLQQKTEKLYSQQKQDQELTVAQITSSFIRCGKFLTVILANILSMLFSLSCPSEEPECWYSYCYSKISYTILTLIFFFFLLFPLDDSHYFIFQIIYLFFHII